MFLVCSQLFLMLMHVSTGMLLTQYTDCGSLSQIHEVDNINCYEEPCNFIEGRKYTGFTTFTPKVNHAIASLEVDIIISGASTTVIHGVDQCSNGLRCPLHAGEKTSWILTQEIPPIFHLLPRNFTENVALKYELKDQADNEILCIVLPVTFNKI